MPRSGCARSWAWTLDGQSMASLDRKTLGNAAMAEVRFVEEILRRWDPIGVEPGAVAPADEYDSYAPHIVSMVRGGCTVENLAAHLEHLAVENMGLGPSSSSNKARNLEFATQIVGGLRPSNQSPARTRGDEVPRIYCSARGARLGR